MKAGRCRPLRRSPIGVAFGPFGFGPVVLLALFGAMSFVDATFVYFVAVCGPIAAFPLFRPLRLCSGALMVPRFILPEFRQPLDEIVRVEIGVFGWSGLAGYRGVALALHTTEKRRLVYHSLFCGRRRLREWVDLIESSGSFRGSVTWSDESERWEGPHNYPVV